MTHKPLNIERIPNPYANDPPQTIRVVREEPTATAEPDAVKIAIHHLHMAAGALGDDFPEHAQVIADIIADLQSQQA